MYNWYNVCIIKLLLKIASEFRISIENSIEFGLQNRSHHTEHILFSFILVQDRTRSVHRYIVPRSRRHFRIECRWYTYTIYFLSIMYVFFVSFDLCCCVQQWKKRMTHHAYFCLYSCRSRSYFLSLHRSHYVSSFSFYLFVKRATSISFLSLLLTFIAISWLFWVTASDKV